MKPVYVRNGVEYRYADMPWGRELDEIVTNGLLHMEDLGTSIHVGISTTEGDAMLGVWLAPLPKAMWWEEVTEAWHERRLPCFWRPILVALDPDQGILATTESE